jgi:hypothetical protein
MLVHFSLMISSYDAVFSRALLASVTMLGDLPTEEAAGGSIISFTMCKW